MAIFPCRSECKDTVGKQPKDRFNACVKDCRAKKKASKKGDDTFGQALAMLGQDTSKEQGGGSNTGLIIGVIIFLIVISVVVFLMMKKRGTTARA